MFCSNFYLVRICSMLSIFLLLSKFARYFWFSTAWLWCVLVWEISCLFCIVSLSILYFSFFLCSSHWIIFIDLPWSICTFSSVLSIRLISLSNFSISDIIFFCFRISFVFFFFNHFYFSPEISYFFMHWKCILYYVIEESPNSCLKLLSARPSIWNILTLDPIRFFFFCWKCVPFSWFFI